MLDPLQADHAEFGRMVPEKVEAFSTAGRIALNYSSEANLHLTRLASDEVFATARAAIDMASCATPVALAQAQMRFAIAWVDRATANFFALGTLALKSQDAVMAPLRDAVAINGQRLVQV